MSPLTQATPSPPDFTSYFNKDDEKELCREELEKVARFAKHHVPEQHEGDKAKYVEERINTLMQYQIASVLNVIAASESKKVGDRHRHT